MLAAEEIRKILDRWNDAWNAHDLDEVMGLFSDDVVFENWTGATARGREALRKAWEPWFRNHGDFRFITEDIFIDERQQKVLFQWVLEWPSPEKAFAGKREKRRGVDIMHFRNGKIFRKATYSKTTVEIEGQRVAL
jgi:steroid delta-isomerase-like uncharacterized protein